MVSVNDRRFLMKNPLFFTDYHKNHKVQTQKFLSEKMMIFAGCLKNRKKNWEHFLIVSQNCFCKSGPARPPPNHSTFCNCIGQGKNHKKKFKTLRLWECFSSAFFFLLLFAKCLQKYRWKSWFFFVPAFENIHEIAQNIFSSLFAKFNSKA